MQNIDQAKFIELAKTGKYVILDVRRPDECATGIIPGARKLNFLDSSLFISEIEQMDKDEKYLIYCRSGNRSGKACQMMDNLGFSTTYNLIGGMMSWTGNVQ